MSGIQILPNELINIVDEYAYGICITKVGNIKDLIDDYDINSNVWYCPNIVVLRKSGENETSIYYKNKLAIRTMCKLDNYMILDNTKVYTHIYTFDLERQTKVANVNNHSYCVNNEKKQYYYNATYSKWHDNAFRVMQIPNANCTTLITSKGNRWSKQIGNLYYNGEIVNIGINSPFELMCSINNDFVVLRGMDTFYAYACDKLGNTTKIHDKEVYRFYGQEYIVDIDGDVYNLCISTTSASTVCGN